MESRRLILEADRAYFNLSPKGEPALGRCGLYSQIDGSDAPVDRLAMLWVLNLSHGNHSLLDVAEQSGLAFETIAEAARSLEQAGLLADRSGSSAPARDEPGPTGP